MWKYWFRPKCISWAWAFVGPANKKFLCPKLRVREIKEDVARVLDVLRWRLLGCCFEAVSPLSYPIIGLNPKVLSHSWPWTFLSLMLQFDHLVMFHGDFSCPFMFIEVLPQHGNIILRKIKEKEKLFFLYWFLMKNSMCLILKGETFLTMFWYWRS